MASGTKFKEIVSTPHSNFERSHEDNESNFLISSDRRFYSSSSGTYGAIPISQSSLLDAAFDDVLDPDDEAVYVLARQLVFGDPNYPIVVAPNNRDPHFVQEAILKQSRELFPRIGSSGPSTVSS